MSQAHAESHKMSGLMLAALGVVYGDIGTSPLYALKEAFSSAHHAALLPTEGNVLGVLSMVVWTLLIVVTFKYVMIVLRADNQGEGGVVALTARVVEHAANTPRRKTVAVTLGLIGASLLYGDGVITPAISVLSAIEGLEVATPAVQPYVVPITVGVLAGLFFVQRHGTDRVGKIFGPVMVVWFLVLAVVGLLNIVKYPAVLSALSPHHAIVFAAEHPFASFLAMGAVFLTVTGGEALYADMGHFGERPIRYAWVGIVLPCLLLNYMGQSALLIVEPAAARNPFFMAVPGWALYPVVALATCATVIASQALITGAYSVTLQLIQLGYCPRMTVHHTSGAKMGQIYLPFVNWALLVLVVVVVLGFKTSSNLAAAYGIAVTLTMLVTTFLLYAVARREWKWRPSVCALVFAPLIVIEPVFLAANGTKIIAGGWFPLVFGGVICILLTTWHKGREIVAQAQSNNEIALKPFVALLESESIHRVPHTAVFLTQRPEHVPPALLHNLKHNMVLHEHTIFVSLSFVQVPRVPNEERVFVEQLGNNLHRVRIFFGFMEEPDVPDALAWCGQQGLEIKPGEVSYFLSRETLLPTTTTPGGMPFWQDVVFEFMFRNATSAAKFFNLPTGRVVELGSRVMI